MLSRIDVLVQLTLKKQGFLETKKEYARSGGLRGEIPGAKAMKSCIQSNFFNCCSS